jgi:hypothetical protein
VRIAVLTAAILLLLFACRRSGERLGRVLERLETSEGTNDVQRRTLEAAARRPRDRGELADRLPDAGSDLAAVAVWPPVVDYGAGLQLQSAAELEAMPEGSAVAVLITDYAVMRDQARAGAAP